MKTHLKTVASLHEKRAKNERSLMDLCKKIEVVDDGIDTFRRARRVLNCKRRKILIANIALDKRIAYELASMQKLEETQRATHADIGEKCAKSR